MRVQLEKARDACFFGIHFNLLQLENSLDPGIRKRSLQGSLSKECCERNWSLVRFPHPSASWSTCIMIYNDTYHVFLMNIDLPAT